MPYNFKKIEAKLLKKWFKDKTYEPDLDKAKKPFYNLMMFPYPSAEGLHVGNMYAFVGSDIYGRYMRMRGYDIFEPMGLDGFGIHSENYAIKIGTHPVKQAKKSEKNFYRQLQTMGNGFAWDERLETYDPEYYKWTQWIFLQMFKNGLAYRKRAEVNWCPSCKTVLADEQVIGGECERCGTKAIRKELEQWFFRITKYADRLLKNLDGIDWTRRIKLNQKNWIGKSEGATIRFNVKSLMSNVNSIDDRRSTAPTFIEAFTTRPDTLYGATYVVLAPEYILIENLKLKIENWDEVNKYIVKSKKKSEADRISEGQEKTGIELKGLKAINPANNEEIPIFVSDYVIGSYGTGAVMAVPAHDPRDWEFAKKFGLPIREVIMPETPDLGNPPRAGKENTFRKVILGIVRNPRTDKFLVLRWKKLPWITFITGGIDDGEDAVSAARREIKEETGYKNLKLVRVLGGLTKTEFFAKHKDVNRSIHATSILFELEDDEQEEISSEERDTYNIDWLSSEEISKIGMRHGEFDLIWKRIKSGVDAYEGSGVLINSDKFNGMDSERAKWEITKLVGGEKKEQYRLRDWLISRQRYWGPPIPMIYCEGCNKNGLGERKDAPGWYTVKEKDLPVKLPYIKDFRPKGKDESPLASVKSFYEVKCSYCGNKARRETDVSDTFLDSAWYFFRYVDHKNKKEAFSNNRIQKWLPVDMYIGGAEHSVLHLLYVRFLTMVFKDIGLLPFEEPFKKFRAHGLLIKEGVKISKSKGNVVDPDEYIKKFGVDTLRTYLMFLGPFEQGGDWRDEGIMGIVRFLNRVWAMSSDVSKSGDGKGEAISKFVHAYIKSLSEDLPNLNYNTCVSSLMVFLNRLEKEGIVKRLDFEIFLKLLAPFAPFITEELWEKLGHKNSIHKEEWPVYREDMVYGDTFELVVQINGKLRGRISVSRDTNEEDTKKIVLENDKISSYLKGAKINRVIFVPNKLINFVI